MKKWIGLLWLLSLLLTACHTHDHDCDHDHDHHDDHDHHSHDDHDDHEDIINYTRWNSKVELLAEFEPLVVGANNFRLVLSDLTNFQALETTVLITINGKEKVTASSKQKGVYEAILSFSQVGNISLLITTSDASNSSFSLENLPVAADEKAAHDLIYPDADVLGSIVYQRELAWNSFLKISEVEIRSIGSIIHTSGILEPSNADLFTVVAKSDGVVNIIKKNSTSGTAVRAGELLFTVTGKGILEDDLEMNFLKAQSNLQTQQSNWERKKKLLDEQIIGQKEYDQALNEYELAQAEFDNLKKFFNKGEKRHLITATQSGFITQLAVQEGQFVKAGTPLVTIVQTSRVQIKVDISPRFRAQLASISTAKFVNPYNNKVYNLSDLEGKVSSFGKMTNPENGHYIPLYFEINNHPDLLAGTMIEAYLISQTGKEQLVVPKSAVLEEMGSYVVFVQKNASSYEKQVVEIGNTDGEWLEIISGLSVNDRLVTQGVLQIKLASMAGTVDPHAGHQH